MTKQNDITFCEETQSDKDNNGNIATVHYFGSKEAALQAIKSCTNCEDCTNCDDGWKFCEVYAAKICAALDYDEEKVREFVDKVGMNMGWQYE